MTSAALPSASDTRLAGGPLFVIFEGWVEFELRVTTKNKSPNLRRLASATEGFANIKRASEQRIDSGWGTIRVAQPLLAVWFSRPRYAADSTSLAKPSQARVPVLLGRVAHSSWSCSVPIHPLQTVPRHPLHSGARTRAGGEGMAWRTMDAQEQRVRFVVAAKQGSRSFALCAPSLTSPVPRDISG